jgi:hypothetical protein
MGDGKEKRRRSLKKKKPPKHIEECMRKTQGQRSRFRQKPH